jgi:serine/threonine protein kinase
MAEVWAARRADASEMQPPIVVKRILPHLSQEPRFVELFLREARLAACLYHGNVVRVFEVGEADGQYFLAMEHVRGCSLAELLSAHKAQGPVPPGLSALVARDLSRALGYVHSAPDENGRPLRIVHRDVSPSNVMLGIDGSVKLVDFGLARALAALDDRSGSSTVRGKLAYMAPEVLEGASADHRSDIYATGVLLCEMLAGRRIRRSKGPADLVPWSSSHVPPALEAICRRATAELPEDRYQDAGEMAAALEPVVSDLRFGPLQLGEVVRSGFSDRARADRIAVVPEFEPDHNRPMTESVSVRSAPAPGRSPRRLGWKILALIGLAWAVDSAVPGATRPRDATPPVTTGAAVTRAVELPSPEIAAPLIAAAPPAASLTRGETPSRASSGSRRKPAFNERSEEVRRQDELRRQDRQVELRRQANDQPIGAVPAHSPQTNLRGTLINPFKRP